MVPNEMDIKKNSKAKEPLNFLTVQGRRLPSNSTDLPSIHLDAALCEDEPQEGKGGDMELILLGFEKSWLLRR